MLILFPAVEPLLFSFQKFKAMKLNKVVILCLLLATTNVLFSQNQEKVDSLLKLLPETTDTNRINVLRLLFMEYIYVDYKIAKEYLDEELVIAEEVDIPYITARLKNEEGVYYSVISDNENAVKTFNESLDLYQTLGNQERVSALLNNISNCHRNMGNLALALDYQMQSLKIKEAIPVDGEKLSASYWNIGNITGDIGNYEESNVWYRKAEVYYDTAGLKDDWIAVRYNLALNLKALDSVDQALPMFEEAMAYYEENNLNNDLAAALDNLGQINDSQGNYAAAKDYYEKSLAISENHGERSLIALTRRKLGLIYSKLGRHNQAIQLIKSAQELGAKTQTRKWMYNHYHALAEAYEAKGDFGLAIQQFALYDSLKSEVMSEENIKKINELEIKYQTEKKEQEIALQENEIQLLEQKAVTARIRQFALLLGLIGVILLLGSVYYAFRQKFKRQRAEKQKVDAELDHKKKELTSFTLQLSHKNEILETLKKNIKELKSNVDDTRQYNRLINTIDINIKDDANWDNFKMRFEQVHKDFNTNIKRAHPRVTSNELRLMALLKMNLSSKEIATLLNISQEGVKKARQRLRKKLELQPEMPLEDVVYSF